jgi:integrase/recombinase XerD
VRGKGAQRLELPLPYGGRQSDRRLSAPGQTAQHQSSRILAGQSALRGFRSACGGGSIVWHSLQRAGIDAPTAGAHQFRHGLATEMLRQGASLSEIGELLGHRHAPTTKIYTQVDIRALRALALLWPGGVR